MKKLRFWIVCAALWSCVATFPAAAQERFKLTILHTNDTHGHLMPYSYPETYNPGAPIAKLKSRRDIGGAARRSTLVKRIRAEKGHETLLIDAGDICDGTPFSTEFHGDADVAVMNSVGYDIACPGNHEFSNLLPQVGTMLRNATFPLISANIFRKSDHTPIYKPYIIRQVGLARIAFLGLLTYDARTYRGAKDDCVMDRPIDAAKKWVPELRKQADMVVLVTHIGVEEDLRVAREVPGIDVIVGGHSHTLLPKPVFVASTAPKVEGSINGTVVVQDFQWAGTLGRLDLTIRKSTTGNWAVEKYNGKLLPITKSIPEDPATAGVVSKFWDPIKHKFGEKIGAAAGDFAEKGTDAAEYNLMADAVREKFNSDFDMENSGGVRAPIPKGDITYGDAVNVDPFGNTVFEFNATGAQVKSMLARFRPAVSGIRYKLSGGVLEESTIGDAPIDEAKVYRGTTNNFFATTLLRDITDKRDLKVSRLEVLVEYIRKYSPIKPAYDGRRVIIRSSGGDQP